MNATSLNKLLAGKGIDVIDFISNAKASEEYVDVKIDNGNGDVWCGYVPYQYRRTGVHITTEKELAEYLISIKSHFTKQNIKKFIQRERKFWKEEKADSDVTIEFFMAMLSMKWTDKFPANNNPQRRIQDIKELGYTLATRFKGRSTERILLPLPRGTKTGYETFTFQFKSRVIRLLDGINAFEAKKTNANALIPDHKFSEIRWDENTREENGENMTDEEIVKKFQLLDNQRNQQKREICRQCYQSNVRGIIYGIKYFYKGGEKWDPKIPVKGKAAEKGCIGCPWYDIQVWRDALNKELKKK